MTVKQVQCLLAYLGYDPGGIDGVTGQNTMAAVRRFQADYGLTADGDAGAMTKKMLVGAVAGTATKTATAVKPVAGADAGAGAASDSTAKTGTFWDTIKYFKRTDPYIGCSCGACGGFPVEPKEKLMRLADAVRAAAGKPMIPTSTVRCKTHNAEVGGVATSRHMLGQAMDFAIPGLTASQILSIVRQQKDVAYTYAIDDGHVHMDVVL